MAAAPNPRSGVCCKPGGRLDMSHGFVHHIRRNQLARDDYDKKVKQAAKEKTRRRHTPAPTRPRKPDLQVYLPRHRGEAARPDSAPLAFCLDVRPSLYGKKATSCPLGLSSSGPCPDPPPRRSRVSAQRFSRRTGRAHELHLKHLYSGTCLGAGSLFAGLHALLCIRIPSTSQKECLAQPGAPRT
ncbi:UPF0561 protein C2orf68 homolog isoform X1 [Erinaceus europaeus]|uniref:UPF0561 protein C2orf68 homolog isoform X1 n=1 Tax=Erinaceus europaeus TaxID=9365 RepID=A0A1S3WK21_ERIEU|nr:UPF0561 protein C2orf68 homolog isoform X1 [Erinaceus europaeus]